MLLRVIAKMLRISLEVQRAKDKALSKLIQKYDHRVGYGVFKGMLLGKNVHWSKNDKITQILGVYEEHVLKKLQDFRNDGADTFIDIGAADGYFCVGFAYADIFKHIWAYEISQKGRDNIRENAANNFCENRLSVQSEANFQSINLALNKDKKAAILIDIEGGEYDLLDDNMLSLMSGNFIICELHPWMREDGYEHQSKLLERAGIYFNIEIIDRNSYNPNKFEELFEFTDEERLIVLGEGRQKKMDWLVMTPLKNN